MIRIRVFLLTLEHLAHPIAPFGFNRCSPICGMRFPDQIILQHSQLLDLIRRPLLNRSQHRHARFSQAI